MYQITFSHPVRIHFIGIGGISMSGLALILLKEGFTVSGSDSQKTDLTMQLEKAGARVMYGQSAENLSPGCCDVVVYTAAVHKDNPEFARAVELGFPMLTRAELLGEVMQNYDMSAAVAGTHGKTTTTSMLSLMALEGGLDPTITVGGILKDIGGNIRIGSSPAFVAEACEYTNSFLSLHPWLSIILNIDADHLDFFKDLAHIRASFQRFARLVPENGVLVIWSEIPDLDEFLDGLKCRVLTFGLDEGMYHAQNITFDDYGYGSFDLIRADKNCGRFTLSVPGEHNITNALAAIAAADAMGVPFDAMRRALSDFKGTDRRFEKKGTINGAVIIDDYAHHPTEIKATLKAAFHYPHKKIWCVFQPHTFTRTKALFGKFAEVLARADEVLLAPIYAARETDDLGVSSDLLAEAVSKYGVKATSMQTFEEIEDYLANNVQEGDLILTVGAGSVTRIGADLAARGSQEGSDG